MPISAADAAFWRKASALYDLVAELPAGEQETALETAAPDPELRDAVRRWLGAPLARVPEQCPLPPEALASGPLEPGTMLGAWRITRLAGEGGMGLVYEAERADGSFERRVALKVTSGPATSASLERFLAERRILAGLEHPNIAQLLDAGITDEGEPWFAMEYVDGEPLHHWCVRHQAGAREIVRLFRQVTAAVSHAHRRLVIHRDLKPSNLLVTAGGTVKLVDFGIAEPEAAGGPGGVSSRALTPAYASPEQRRGEGASVAGDVYSLGVVLGELLTGRRPGDVGGGEAALPGDLGLIVAKALRADPADRYPSVEALDADLGAWLDGMPVAAHPDLWSYRARRFVGRHPVAVFTTVAVALLLLGLTAVAQVQATRAKREAARAEQVATFLIGLLEFPYPFDSAGKAVSMRAMLDAGRRQADSLIETDHPPEPDILESLALGYSGLADYETSAAVNRRALELRQRRGDSDSAQSISRLLIAVAEMLAGHAQAAREALVPALEPVRTHYGGQSDRMAQFVVTLGNIERRLGHLAAADSLGREALRIIAANGNSAQVALGHALTQLGHVAMERGDWAAAEREYQRSVEVRSASGGSPLELASALGNVAMAQAEQGRFAEAAERLARARAIRTPLIDPLDPELTDQLRQEARLAWLSGRPREAAAMYRDALDRYARAHSSPHWRTTPAMVGLGQALVGLQRLLEAEAVLAAALDSLAQNVEGQSRLRAEARGALAAVLRARGKGPAADSVAQLATAELAALRRD